MELITIGETNRELVGSSSTEDGLKTQQRLKMNFCRSSEIVSTLARFQPRCKFNKDGLKKLSSVEASFLDRQVTEEEINVGLRS